MNEEYIEYIDQLLDLAERNDIFSLTTREFNEFASEVSRTLEKQKPMKPEKCQSEPLIKHGWDYQCPVCEKTVGVNEFSLDCTDEWSFCPSCGQKLDWTEE